MCTLDSSKRCATLMVRFTGSSNACSSRGAMACLIRTGRRRGLLRLCSPSDLSLATALRPCRTSKSRTSCGRACRSVNSVLARYCSNRARTNRGFVCTTGSSKAFYSMLIVSRSSGCMDFINRNAFSRRGDAIAVASRISRVTLAFNITIGSSSALALSVNSLKDTAMRRTALTITIRKLGCTIRGKARVGWTVPFRKRGCIVLEVLLFK